MSHRDAAGTPVSEEPEYGLVMPFVVCKSQGGPYDDAAFVAGARMELISQTLERQPDDYQTYEPPALLPQLDLVAMRHGYAMTTEDYSDDWTLVRFAPVSVPAGGGDTGDER